MSSWRKPGMAFRLQLVAAFAAIYVIWGSTYLAIRFAVETLPPFLMAGMRFLLAGALLYGWARLRGRSKPTTANWKAAAIVGGFLFLSGNGGVTWASQYIPSGLTASLIAIVPLWMVLLDWVRPGGVRPSRHVMAGLLVGLLGVILLLDPRNAASGSQISLVGMGVVLLSSLSWAVGSLASRGAALPDSTTLSSAMEMLVGGALLVGMGTLTGEWTRLNLGAASLKSVVAFLYLAIGGALVAFSAYGWLLRVSTPARAATYAYVNPMIAVFLGWTLASEPLTPQTLVASGCIVAAVAVITTYRARGAQPGAPHTDEESQPVPVSSSAD